jgi:uncharacterized protein
VRSALFLAAALFAAGCGAQGEASSAKTGDRLPALVGRVVDNADLLTPAEEQRLALASAALERDVGPQFVVATVPSLEGRPILFYSVDLARSWGIGDRDRNDGVLMVVAPNERKARIEVGTGLERRLTDPFSAKVMREQMLPRFREGAMAEGIIAGSEAIVARLRSRQSEAEIAAQDGLVL